MDFQSGRYSKQLSRENLAESLSTLWGEVKGREFSMLPSRVELLATYQIEARYAEALGVVESKLASWKAAAERGRVLSSFGESALALRESSLGAFDRATQAFAVSPLRPKKHEELRALLDKSIAALVKKQLSNLKVRFSRRCLSETHTPFAFVSAWSLAGLLLR